MTERRPGGAVYEVRGADRAVRRAISQFFAGRGWSEHRTGPDRVEYRTGHLWTTILLGGLAGRRFHLVAPIELRPAAVDGSPGIEIHYRWGEQVGLALGGVVGRARAARVHAETAAALEQELAREGLLVRTRRS